MKIVVSLNVNGTNMKQLKRGLVIIYTGEGKGKTTAAIGLAVRAAGYDKQVLIVQFVKSWFTGEIESLKKIPSIEFIQAGKGFYQILGDKISADEHKAAAAGALQVIKQHLAQKKYDVVILDESIGAVVGGLITEKDLLEIIKLKHVDTDIVFTGRHADKLPNLIKKADLVTEMTKIKHPYDEGYLAKKTIDF
ncbi:MAG: cob(I)yrinic acid a,c-diamide adenosyltransferase [Patescibacteria group bacterium]